MTAVQIIVIIGVIAAAIFIFLILREFFCWYFKINERIALQNKTNEILIEGLKKLIDK